MYSDCTARSGHFDRFFDSTISNSYKVSPQTNNTTIMHGSLLDSTLSSLLLRLFMHTTLRSSVVTTFYQAYTSVPCEISKWLRNVLGVQRGEVDEIFVRERLGVWGQGTAFGKESPRGKTGQEVRWVYKQVDLRRKHTRCSLLSIDRRR